MTDTYDRETPEITLSDIDFGRNEETFRALRFLEQELLYYCPVDAASVVFAAHEFSRRKLSFLLPKIHCLSIAEQDGEFAGAALAAKPLALPRGGILWMAVEHDKRNQGIGNALLSHAEQRLAALGARAVILNSAPSAINFYRNNRYEFWPKLKKQKFRPSYRNPLGKSLPAQLQ